MKTRLLIIIVGIVFSSGFTVVVPLVSAQCLVNEDWFDVPCLDEIINGKYNQDDVDRWAEYFQYKGTVFMEEKRSELEQAIQDDTLQNWIDQSDQNKNVYEYYFFSGRAPNTGEYPGMFDEIMINESSTIHDPYTDDERYQLASSKIYTGGTGIEPEFNEFIIIVGILIGSGITFGMMMFWRKRK
jgi:hypothetical protein